jgi:hypothetical protein
MEAVKVDGGGPGRIPAAAKAPCESRLRRVRLILAVV